MVDRSKVVGKPIGSLPGTGIEPYIPTTKSLGEDVSAGLHAITGGLYGIATALPKAAGLMELEPYTQEVLNDLEARMKDAQWNPYLRKSAMYMLRREAAGAEALYGASPLILSKLMGIPKLLIPFGLGFGGVMSQEISKPLEKETGIPAWATDTAMMVAGTAFGFKTLRDMRLEQGTKIQRALNAARQSDPFFELEKTPPFGFNEVTDHLHVKAAERESSLIKEAIDAGDKSATKERTPDLAVKFARGITGDDIIEINADAVHKLYEGKLEEKYSPEDGLLGWVTNLREQLLHSDKDGGPIRVRADEYFGRATKDVHKLLEDDIRRDPDGLTKNQAKEHKLVEEVPRAEIRPEEGFWSVYVDGLRSKTFLTRSAAEEHLDLIAPEQSFEGGLRKAAGIDQVEYDLAAGDVVDIAPSPIANKLVFKLPQSIMDRILKLREKVEKARQDRQFNKAEKRVRAERGPEWQERFDEQLAQTAEDMKDNPQYMIKRLFDDGMIGDQAVEGHVRIDRASLTADERKAIPRNWMAKEGGVGVSDLVRLLGLDSKETLINHITNLEGSRGKASRTDYFSRLLAQEARERMHRKHGDPVEAIYDEAMDHVTDDSTFGMVYEHLLASAMKANKPWTQTKEDFRISVIEDLRGRPFTRRIMEDAHRDMGKAHKDSMAAATKGDWNELLVQQQRYAYNHVLAQEGKRLNSRIKESDKFDKRFGRGKIIEGVATEHTDRIHDIMARTGADVKRGPGAMKDLYDAVDRHDTARKGKAGFSEGLRGFWEEHADRGMAVADAQYENDSMPNMVVYDKLFDKSWVKLPKDMTIGEWEAIADTKKSIAKWGSKVLYEDKAGRRIAHEDLITQITDDIDFFIDKGAPVVTYDKLGIAKDAKPGNLRLMWTALRQLEPIVLRIGRYDPNAPFIRAYHKLVDAANNSRVLETEYGRRLNQLAELTNKFTKGSKMTDELHNETLYEPRTLIQDERGRYVVPPVGSAFRGMTVHNLTTMMLNMGLKSGRQRMADGYGATPETLMDYINTHATKEHWNYVEAVWDLFRDIKNAENERDLRLQGTTIPEEYGVPIDTPFGRIRGQYYPVIHDRGDPFFNVKSDVNRFGNQRARVADGWEKERTTHDGPLSLDIADLNGHLARRIRALGMKEAVIEFGNIIYDRKFQQAFTKAFGKTTMDMWEPFLKDVAGQPGWESPTVQGFGKYFDAIRRGSVQAAAGLSIKILGKHSPTALIHAIGEVGAWRFMEALAHVTVNNKITRDQNRDFIYGKTMIAGREHNGSAEIKGRAHHWYETTQGGVESIMSKPPSAFEARKYGIPTNMSVWKVMKQELIERGAYAIQTADMKIAEAVYYAKYSHVHEDLTPTGMSPWEIHTEAHRLAEFSVRSALGSTAITSRSALFRQAAWYWRGLTAFMGFFNSTQARLETSIFRSKDAFREYAQTGDGKALLQEQKAAGSTMLHYFVLTAAVEQIVESFFHEDESPAWWKWGVKPFAHIGSQMLPAAKSLYTAVEWGSGFNPGMTIVDTGLDKIEKLAQNLTDPRKFRTPRGQIQLIGNGLDVLAATRGIGNFQTSKIGQAMLNVMYAGEIPNDVQDFFNLWNRGTVRAPKHRKKTYMDQRDRRIT